MKSILVESDITVWEQRYKYSRIYQLCEYFVIRNICEISDNSHWILLLMRKTDKIIQNE